MGNRISLPAIILVGYGKMGRLIFRELQKVVNFDRCYICDPAFPDNCRQDGKIIYIHSLNTLTPSSSLSSSFSSPPPLGAGGASAFIASTAHTHHSVLRSLIALGVKNIFVEKPAVMTVEEYDDIMSIASDCRICTGYILRHSECVQRIPTIIEEQVAQGFCPHYCTVEYSKYLPVDAEPRAQHDIGVFEELPHVWDLIFNYIQRTPLDYFRETYAKFFADPHKADRCIEAVLEYEGSVAGHPVTVALHSSFRSPQRHRQFHFHFMKTTASGAEHRQLLIDLDRPDNTDGLQLMLGEEILCSETYQSLAKLGNELSAAAHYFLTGDTGHLALFKDELTLIRLLKR